MKPIELMHWKSEYSVGVNKLDDQHIELMNQINELISHSIEDVAEGKHFFEETIDTAIKRTAIHFETEEDLLKETSYEVFEDHKREHEELMAKVESMKQELKKANSVKDLYNLTVNFKEWFLSHILLYDKEAKDYFKTGFK
jgi:hemerythrin